MMAAREAGAALAGNLRAARNLEKSPCLLTFLIVSGLVVCYDQTYVRYVGRGDRHARRQRRARRRDRITGADRTAGSALVTVGPRRGTGRGMPRRRLHLVGGM